MCPFYKSVYIITQNNALLSTTVFATNGKRISCLRQTHYPVCGKPSQRKLTKNYNLVFRPYSNKMRFCLLQTVLRKTLQCRLHIVKGKQINKQIQNNTKKTAKNKSMRLNASEGEF